MTGHAARRDSGPRRRTRALVLISLMAAGFGGSRSEQDRLAVSQNRPPTSDAGGDRVVTTLDRSITLVGKPQDLDGTVRRVEWIQRDGPPAQLLGTSTNRLTIVRPPTGLYRFEFVVEDDKGVTASDDVLVFSVSGEQQAEVTGVKRKWHKVTTTFSGVQGMETGNPVVFRDNRLFVYFLHPESGTSYRIPGYFAADGDAAETSASSGDRWRAHFSPNKEGTWHYWAQFQTGTDVAVELDFVAGTSAGFDGAHGSFEVRRSNKTGRDFRGKGWLQYVGEHYLRFAGSGESFVKGAANSPENFLAYAEFDNTTATHQYAPHAADYDLFGGPTWQGEKGRNIFGALNYLADRGMNAVYFLTMNVNGDGNDVWPWVLPFQLARYDCSKLDQWERVFQHMTRIGLMLHVVLQETENDHLLDDGELGFFRKLYFRELIARFAHHPALTWNLGEETSNTIEQLLDYEEYIHELDIYNHLIVVHTFNNDKDDVYVPLLEEGALGGASLQMSNIEFTGDQTLRWVEQSAEDGKPWVVTLDEFGPATDGVVPDSVDFDHEVPRLEALWGNLMNGGAGAEWYFGYQYPNDDLDCEDWRSRDNMWRLTHIALDFFQSHVPFWEMFPDHSLITGSANLCLAHPGQAYVVHLRSQVTDRELNLQSFSDQEFEIYWYDPRNGGPLQRGSKLTVQGEGRQAIGAPPSDWDQDWVGLITLPEIAQEEGPPELDRVFPASK